MAIPLPRVIADVGPGGSITTAMRGQNALTKSSLENMYYGPNIQSEINYRNALKNRTNTLTPLEAAKMELENKFYAPKTNSLIGLQNAETKKIGYMLDHPGYMGGEDTKTIQALMDLGLIDKNNIHGNQTLLYSGNNQPSPGQTTNMLPPVPVNNVTLPVSNTANSLPNLPVQENVHPLNNNPFSSKNTTHPFNTGNPLIDTILNRKFAQSSYTGQMAQAFDWVHSTPEAKTYEIALGAGMGLTPDKFVHERTQGKSIAQIATEQGFDPNNLPAPDFLPTRQNISLLKKRQAALKEVDSLGKFVREGLAPFSRKIAGYSIPQIVKALTGKNKNEQINFLAARILTPELANIRQNLAQGNAGVTAAEEIMHRGLMNIKVLESVVAPDVFLKAQELADEKLKEAFANAEKVYQVPGKKSGNKTVIQKWGRDDNGKPVRLS